MNNHCYTINYNRKLTAGHNNKHAFYLFQYYLFHNDSTMKNKLMYTTVHNLN